MKRLLASIHDVSPKFEGQVDALLDRLSGHLGGPRLAMLVVPDHWRSAAIQPGTPFATRLRGWADAGIEMFVHGWTHKDDTPHANARDAARAKHMTAGEGEFLGLSREEALARMTRGIALVEGITGRPAAGFIAPAWLYSEGARQALGEAGFALAEDHMQVWQPATGRTLAKGPVITWASRSRPRQLSSLAAAGVLRHALKGQSTVRVAVHPGDTTVPQLLTSIDKTFRAFATSHTPARYAELLGRA
jgi:uncharacterized protein